MQSLLNGADCSANANPLNQVLKREGVDNSLYRDRTSGPGPSSFQAPFRPTNLPQQFQPSPSTSRQQTPFGLSSLSQHISPQPQAQHHPQRQPQIQQWAGQFQPQPQSQSQVSRPSSARNWANDFHPSQAAGAEKGKGRAYETEMSQPYMPNSGMSMSMGGMSMGGMGMGMGMQSPYMPSTAYSPQSHEQVRVMREPTDQDFDEAEALIAESQKEEQEPAEPISDEKGEPNFDLVWESLRPEAERLKKLSEWEAEYSQFVENDEEDFEVLKQAMQAGFEDVGQTSLDEQFEVFNPKVEIDTEGMPKRQAYEFEPNNPFVAKEGMTPRPIPSTSSLTSVTDRALALEAQILRRFDPSATHMTADIDSIPTWCELGKVQAMNEKEALAMRAYEAALDLFETAVKNGVTDRVLSEHRAQMSEMMVSLAISYTNESLDLAALRTLHKFLATLHPDFAGPVPQIDQSNPWAPHKLMTDAFLSLARSQYSQQQQVDPDVQVGLGTLYYMVGDFEDAYGCWQAALEERPDEFLLWNRLGATMANSGKPEEAVEAYRRALELNPTYTRAIYNLGVSCLNIGMHKEAAEHFLAGLALHNQPQQAQVAKGLTMSEESVNQSGSLWAVLRRALNAMGESDLAEKAVAGADLELFRRAGFEF